jgi:hypothetical protein
MSADTMVPRPSDPQSLNRFSFVRNNPLKYVDPSGHEELAPSVPNWYLQIQRFLNQAANSSNRIMDRAARGLTTSQSDIVRAVDTEFANPVNAMLIVNARGSFAGTGLLTILDGENEYDSYEAAEAAGNSAGSGGKKPEDEEESIRKGGTNPFLKDVGKHIRKAPSVGKFGDEGFMHWGTSPLDAKNRAKGITREEITKIGLNKDDARFWKNFYQSERKLNPKNRDLHDARIELMERVLQLME